MFTLRLSILVCWVYFLMTKPEIGAVHPEARINATSLNGKYLKSWRGERFAAFLGIPYAEAPVGERRFRDPVPLQLNNESYDASYDRNDCPSIYASNPSEDCLFLNVYTKDTSASKAVVVFVHHGGLYIGSGLSSFVGPEYLMQRDIVLVTFNYRLGTLGFLNLGSRDVPGNAGFKDQVRALQWVKQNIHNFGGNPNDITLMGYSAGGLSVSLHLVSPMSRGLFHKAAVMSGTLPPQAGEFRNDQFALAQKQAKVLGCERFANDADILECFGKFSGDKIASTLRKMFAFGKDNPIYSWMPVVEQDFGQTRFLVEPPFESFRNGNFAKVPVLIGFLSGEFCTSARDIITNPALLSAFNAEFQRLAPICFMYPEPENNANATRSIREHYFDSNEISGTKFDELCSLFSDSLIRFGAQRLADLISKHHSDIFTYTFSYTGRFSNLYYPGEKTVYKAEHGDDLMYLFKTSPASFKPTDPESPVVDFITELIAEFAKNGKSLQIEKYNKNAFVDIQKYEKKGTLFKEAHFWNSLFPID